MSKAEAWKSWVKLKAGALLPDQSAIVRAVTGYRKYLADQSKNRKDSFPAAHAATWLNQRRFEGFLEAPSTPVGATVPTGPGWESDHPETWAVARQKFREQYGSDVVWNSYFAGSRPNGSPYVLVCRTDFERDLLEQKFGEKLSAMFDHPVSFVLAGSPSKPELRH